MSHAWPEPKPRASRLTTRHSAYRKLTPAISATTAAWCFILELTTSRFLYLRFRSSFSIYITSVFSIHVYFWFKSWFCWFTSPFKKGNTIDSLKSKSRNNPSSIEKLYSKVQIYYEKGDISSVISRYALTLREAVKLVVPFFKDGCFI